MERQGQLVHKFEKAGRLIHVAGPRKGAFRLGKGWFIYVTHRNDGWGFADLAGIRRDGILIVQVTTAKNRAAHREKIASILRYGLSALAGDVELWSWGRTKERGFGFVVERYIGGDNRRWDEERFVPSREVP
jgi:hypothetical protein